MQVWRSLGATQVLDFSRALVGACPGGRESAPELFSTAEGASPYFIDTVSSVRSIPAWASAVGAVAMHRSPPDASSSAERPALLVVYLDPQNSQAPGFPSQLTIDLPIGQYVITSYDAQQRLAVGSETACGSPLVCGPPFNGAALALVVRPWYGRGNPSSLGYAKHSHTPQSETAP